MYNFFTVLFLIYFIFFQRFILESACSSRHFADLFKAWLNSVTAFRKFFSFREMATDLDGEVDLHRLNIHAVKRYFIKVFRNYVTKPEKLSLFTI